MWLSSVTQVGEQHLLMGGGGINSPCWGEKLQRSLNSLNSLNWTDSRADAFISTAEVNHSVITAALHWSRKIMIENIYKEHCYTPFTGLAGRKFHLVLWTSFKYFKRNRWFWTEGETIKCIRKCLSRGSWTPKHSGCLVFILPHASLCV